MTATQASHEEIVVATALDVLAGKGWFADEPDNELVAALFRSPKSFDSSHPGREAAKGPLLLVAGRQVTIRRAVTSGSSLKRARESVLSRVRPVARAVAAISRSWAPRRSPLRWTWASRWAWCSATVRS
jgi:hypothetical protein